ncbi:MAG: hypothetical protein PHD72_04180 [Patescibacteria group bacterium]|nr:hypothetical protein [Patescibacteria group bacterium]
MSNGETTINDVLEAINDFAEKTEDRFNKMDDRFNKMDGRFNKVDDRFILLEQKVDQNHLELLGYIRMIETELKDIKERLTRLEKRTIEDADAAAKDVLELRHRVEVLEEKVRQLQPA